MSIIRSYAFVLSLAAAVIYIYAPLSPKDAKLGWLDQIIVANNKSVEPAKPKVPVSPVDPLAVADADEDLDYSIVQWNGPLARAIYAARLRILSKVPRALGFDAGSRSQRHGRQIRAATPE